MARRVYVDSSAYIALLVGGQDAKRVAQALRGRAQVSSVLLGLESTRTLVRMSREGALDPGAFQRGLDRLAADLGRMRLRSLTMDLCTGLAIPVLCTPRSLDLAHLRTALWFHREEPLEAFVSLDRSQLQAARELELPVGPL
jgi:hypothetical protein